MSFKNYKRSVILDFDYDSVKDGVPKASQQMALLNSEFRKSSQVIEDSGRSIDKVVLKHEQMSNKVSIQKDKVKQLKDEISQLSTTDEKHQKIINRKTIELNNAEAQLMRYEKQTKELSRQLEFQETGFGKLSYAVKDFSENAKEAGYDLDVIAGNMQKVGAVLSGVGIASMKMAGTLNQELAKTATIADLTTVSMEDLKEGVIDISNQFNIESAQVAKGLYNINSGNIETSESLELLYHSAKLVKAGFTDMETATTLMTQILNSYNISVSDAGEITDKLIKMQKLGQLTVGEFGDEFGKVAGKAAKAKIPIEELMGVMTILTVSGAQNPAEAMTALSTVLNQIIKPSQQASEAAKKYGVQLSLASVEAKGFAGWLEHVKTRTRGSDEALTELFGSSKAIQAMFSLTGESAELLTENIDELKDSIGFTDEALEQLNIAEEKFSNALNVLRNNLILAGAALEPLLNLISKFLYLLSAIPPEVITILSVVGMVLLTAGTLMKTIMGISETATTMSKIFNFSVSPALTTIVGKVVLLIAALTALLALFVALTGKADDVGKISDSLAKQTSSFTNQAKQAQSNAMNQVNRSAGHHFWGKERVPHDNYPSFLHEDEQVISADDPRNTNTNPGGYGGDNIVVNVNASDLRSMADVVQLFEDLKRAKRGGVVHG